MYSQQNQHQLKRLNLEKKINENNEIKVKDL